MANIPHTSLSDEYSILKAERNARLAEEERQGLLPQDSYRVLREHQFNLAKNAEWDDFPSVGSTFPDFALPNVVGKTVKRDEFLATGPLVIVFYRGGWCPYCNIALRSYNRWVVPELGALGARIVAISPQVPDESLATMQSDGLDFEVLSDLGCELAKSLNLAYKVPDYYIEHMDESLGLDLQQVNGVDEDNIDLVTPATFIIDQSATIRFTDIHPDYTGRTEPAAIVAALREISKT